MIYKLKTWIVILLLALAVIFSFAFPRAKYEGTDFIRKLKIPFVLSNWVGEDISPKLNIKPGEDIFNFISDFIVYQYVNKQGETLIFIILDAGNFHHPKVCFTGAGYKIRELDDTEFNIRGDTLRIHTLFTEKGKENFLSFYWIVIDKNVAHEWIEQKLKQLYFSLFNKKRVGLMVRIDIPTTKDNIKNSMTIAKDFISNLNKALYNNEADYIFGQH